MGFETFDSKSLIIKFKFYCYEFYQSTIEQRTKQIKLKFKLITLFEFQKGLALVLDNRQGPWPF